MGGSLEPGGGRAPSALTRKGSVGGKSRRGAVRFAGLDLQREDLAVERFQRQLVVLRERVEAVGPQRADVVDELTPADPERAQFIVRRELRLIDAGLRVKQP